VQLVRPRSREQPGNRVNENCDGLVAPFPALTTRIAASWNVKGTRVRLVSLLLRAPLPRGLKAELRCSGKKCPFKKHKLTGEEEGPSGRAAVRRASSRPQRSC
jgi:hypothetical protein